MRQVIDKFLYEHEDCVLLVADFGKFQMMSKTDRLINVQLSESLMTNIAIGLASTGKHVYVYTAAGFTLFRAFDSIKHNISQKSHLKCDHLPITFLNAGSGFIYSRFGETHYLFDDLELLSRSLSGIETYIPYDGKSTYDMLSKSYELNSPAYIRLCPDSMPDQVIPFHTANPDITIYAAGWLVQQVSKICNEKEINADVVPLTDLCMLYKKKSCIISDSTRFDKYLNGLFIDDDYDDFRSDVHSDVVKHYRFDDKSIEDVIRRSI